MVWKRVRRRGAGALVLGIASSITLTGTLAGIQAGMLAGMLAGCELSSGPIPDRARLLSSRLSPLSERVCIEVEDASTEEGARLVQNHCMDVAWQRWKLVSAGEGYYYVISEHTNTCLTVPEASQEDLARVALVACRGDAHQQWMLAPNKQGNAYAFMARHAGKCLIAKNRIALPGSPLVQDTCVGEPHEQWLLAN